MVEASKQETNGKLVFISHDTRDAKIADSFSQLLKRVSNNKIVVFRATAHGREGIPSGKEWFRTINQKINEASCMVCLLTTHSIERPWVYWEVGVAYGKGKQLSVIAIRLPISDARKGPFEQIQITDDDPRSLMGCLNALLENFNLEKNDFLIKMSINEFIEELDNILLETNPPDDLETNPPVYNETLYADPEVARTIQLTNCDLWSIDGFIEICRSIQYTGWSRNDMAEPQVIPAKSLPQEFISYKGDDVLCKEGSQSRYSLINISEPLHDNSGPAHIETTLAQTDYRDMFRLSKLLDKPFIKRGNQLVSGRNIYGHVWYPLDKSPLIHNVNAQPIVITKDEKVILLKRSNSLHHYPGTWSASLEEQMVGYGDTVNKPDLTYFDCAERGVREELACSPDPTQTRILSVGIEYGNLSASFLCVVRISETFNEVYKKWLRDSIDIYENTAIDYIKLNRRELEQALRNREYHPSPKVHRRGDASQAKWHPTARMRLYALKRYIENLA